MHSPDNRVSRRGRVGLRATVLTTAIAVISGTYAPTSQAGATFKIDDTKWISLGMGIRTAFSAAEGRAGRTDDKWSTDFRLDNLRLYLNGQIHEYIKFTFNTECANCGDGGDIRILDGIAQFEFNDYANVWIGRQLVPEGRTEMNGPFYSATYEPFKTPFEPSDSTIQNVLPGPDAGTFGRDEGINIWGAAFDGHFKYVVGAFEGLKRSYQGNKTANADGNFLYATRLAYQFWNVEKAPGYYTGGTAYGANGDILTLAAFAQYQEDGAGSLENPKNMLLAGGDLLVEYVMRNQGVATFNAEFKHFSAATPPSGTNFFPVGGFPTGFQGNSITGNFLYLIPDKIWIGQFQPYVMYTEVMAQNGPNQGEFEAGVNYVIDGFNARVSLLYQYGDLSNGGAIWDASADGNFTNAVKLGVQLQI